MKKNIKQNKNSDLSLSQKLQVEFEKPFNRAFKLAARSLGRISILRGEKDRAESEQVMELPEARLVDEEVIRLRSTK